MPRNPTQAALKRHESNAMNRLPHRSTFVPPPATGRTPQISLVAPCYNEEAVLPELYQRSTRALREAVGDDYELILINDGSTDATWAMIRDLTERDPHVVGVDLSRNFGHQRALTAGLNLARGAAVFVIDADLQDPPELLGDMLRLLEEGADVVYGQRLSREAESWFKRSSAAIFYRVLARLTDIDIPPDTGDFRLMRRPVVEALLSMPEYHRFVRGMVAWLGFRQVPLRYHREKRFAGVTKYPLRRMLHLAADAITSFSIAPLRISTYFGFLFSGLALLTLFYILGSWWFYNATPGWTSLMLLTAVIGGIQLIAVGIMGEYLGRIYLEVKHRPNFIIREIAMQPTPSPEPPPTAD
jgi:glycosyltransferase involved in cell wall biosynthesis